MPTASPATNGEAARSRKPRKPIDPNETKAGKFKRLAENRVSNILDGFRTLGALADTGSYDYTADQVKTIFDAVMNAHNACIKAFQDGGTSGKAKSFAL